MLRVMFTTSTISADSFHSNAGVPAVQGKSILLSGSVEFLMSPGNSAAAVFSCADLRLTVVLRICLLTMCHVNTDEPDVPPASTFTILWTSPTRRGIARAGSTVNIE